MPDSTIARIRDRVDVEGWIRRWEEQRSRRTTWDSHWREVDEFFWPRQDAFSGQGIGSGSAQGGEKRTEKIFDITAPLALDRGAGGLASLTIPQQQRWHRLRATDEKLNDDAEVKAWFEEVTRILFAVRGSPKANYYAQAHEGFMSELAFGNHCQFTDASPSGGVRYRNVHVGQVWIDVDHQGRVDTIFRRLMLSAKAAYQQWGHVWGDPPEKLRAALEQGKADLFEFLHIVAPRQNVDPERLGPEAMPFQSLYLFPQDKRLLDKPGGYWELPYQYPRWQTNPHEIHGRGPAMLALPAVKVVNQQERTGLRVGHLAADPPVMLGDEGVFGQGSRAPRFVPGAVIPGMLDSQGRERAKPFISGGRFELTFEQQQAKREQIQAAFNNDLFRILVQTEQMTATEVLERVQEKGQLLAPAIGRLQSEWFGPQIHVELSILARQGLLPPPPDALLEAGGQYEVEYVSPATRMQRSEELVAISRSIELVTPLAAIDPKVLLKFKADKVIDKAMDILGGPSDVLRTDEEFGELMGQMMEQEQRAAMSAGMEQDSGTAKNLAQAFSVVQGGKGPQASAA